MFTFVAPPLTSVRVQPAAEGHWVCLPSITTCWSHLCVATKVFFLENYLSFFFLSFFLSFWEAERRDHSPREYFSRKCSFFSCVFHAWTLVTNFLVHISTLILLQSFLFLLFFFKVFLHRWHQNKDRVRIHESANFNLQLQQRCHDMFEIMSKFSRFFFSVLTLFNIFFFPWPQMSILAFVVAAAACYFAFFSSGFDCFCFKNKV